jgi:hypothetical protein
MYKDLLLSVLLTICFNWTIAMQILNQTSKDKRTRIFSVALALVTPFIFGLIIFSLL